MMAKNKDGINEQQEIFCQNYVIYGNGARAAREAGYAENSARVQASQLLTQPNIKARIGVLTKERNERTKMTADMVLLEIARIATTDLASAYDESGRLLHPHEMPEDVRRTIAGIEVFEEFEGYGKEREKIGETTKVKFWDKTKALEMYAKHHKLLTDKVEHSGKVSLEDIVAGSPEPTQEPKKPNKGSKK